MEYKMNLRNGLLYMKLYNLLKRKRNKWDEKLVAPLTLLAVIEWIR